MRSPAVPCIQSSRIWSHLVAALVAWSVLHPLAAIAEPLFDAPFRLFKSGPSSSRLEIRDVNRDGRPDLVTADYGGRNVSILLGNGDGTFSHGLDFATSGLPTCLAVGDLTGDGNPDVATGDLNGSVSVLLGNGDGTFQAYREIQVGTFPLSIAIDDMNVDGRLDVVVGKADPSLQVLIGDGTGAFVARSASYLPANPQSIAIGDLNGDGARDAAVAVGGGVVSVAWGDGLGSFYSRTDLLAGAYPVSVAIADFNGDHKLDLVSANSIGASTISILQGNGNGTFQPHVEYEAGLYPTRVTARDLNADGKVDLLVADGNGPRAASVLLGNGDGTMGPPRGIGPRVPAFAVATADLNADGALDVALVHQGAIAVLPGHGDGTFGGSPREFATADQGSSIAASDLDRDGKIDIVVGSREYPISHISVLRGSGEGTLEPHVDYETGGTSWAVDVADWNGDGRVDLAAGNFEPPSVSLLAGRGDATFGPRQDIPMGGAVAAVAVADVNADATPDLVAAVPYEKKVAVLLGKGGGSFQPAIEYETGGNPWSVALCDLNRDGRPDLVTGDLMGNGYASASVLLGLGDGKFGPHADYSTHGLAAFGTVAAADLDRDGRLDLAIATDGAFTVMWGNGDGTLGAMSEVETGFGLLGLSIGDLNHDGVLDVVTEGAAPGCWVNLGKGARAFGEPIGFGSDGGGAGAVIADLNRDHKLDLAVLSPALGGTCGVTVLLNTGPLSNGAPDCSQARAVPPVIMRRDHSMVGVRIEGIADPEGDPLAITVTRVTQDEPPESRDRSVDGAHDDAVVSDGADELAYVPSPDDGQVRGGSRAPLPRKSQGCPDAAIGASGDVAVRAERSAQGDGRVYTIGFSAADNYGGLSEGTVRVCVPVSAAYAACRDDGQAFNSLGPCSTDIGHGHDTHARLSVGPRSQNVITLEYGLPEDAELTIAVYDIAGRRVANLVHATQSAGDHTAVWDTSGLARGLYFCRLQAGTLALMRSVLVLE